MADYSCAWTKRTSHWPAPMSREAPVRFRVSVVVAALVLTGCNANQAINPSSQPPSQVFAGRYVDYNPYDPISCTEQHRTRRRRWQWPLNGVVLQCHSITAARGSSWARARALGRDLLVSATIGRGGPMEG